MYGYADEENIVRVEGRQVRCQQARAVRAGYARSTYHRNSWKRGFFLSSIQKLDKEFEGLFDTRDDEEDDALSGRGGVSNFMRYYGWIYQTELVATLEKITLEQAYEIPTLQYLNDLAYLKAKGEYEAEQLKKAYGKKY